MLVEISSDAAAFLRKSGGQLWVWAARPAMCCAGAPAWMHAATAAPGGLSGFAAVPAGLPAGLQVYFRALGDLRPDVLEIGMTGRRRPAIAAYWDGCLMAMT